MNPPRFLFLQVNDICNLRCQHCCYWRTPTRSHEKDITFERKLEILSEFAELNPRGTVVTCGGESMLDKNFFSLCETCHLLGLRSLSVVNGTQITTPDKAARMIQDGPDEISISLDSHRPDLHDKLRGMRGSFQSATQALRLLLNARRRLGMQHKRIYAMLLVTTDNYMELDPAYDFVLNKIGADKLKLNFLQPTIGYMGNTDWFFANHSKMDPEKLEACLRLCDSKYHLNMNPAWIKLVLMYAKSICKIPPHQMRWTAGPQTDDVICDSPKRNITINLEGIARLCFSEYYPGCKLERVGDLQRFWEGSDHIRNMMSGCKYLCGISHSVRKESCTIHHPDPKP